MKVGKRGQHGNTLIDTIDYLWIMSHDRILSPISHGYVRIPHYYGPNRNANLHRLILEQMIGRALLSSETVDHINGDPRDNRRQNLRLASSSENNRNRKKHSRNTSGFKGVSFKKSTGKWQARIRYNNATHSLGCYETPQEAYDAYCGAAQAYHANFAKLD